MPLPPLREELDLLPGAPLPDGQYAYRVRATLEGETAHRVGLKGTAKLQGDWVPLAYWMLRRPLAALRGLAGL